jgi:hypothetical protein
MVYTLLSVSIMLSWTKPWSSRLIYSLVTRWGDKQRWWRNLGLRSWSRISKWRWGRWRRENMREVVWLGKIMGWLRHPGLGDIRLGLGSLILLVLSMGGLHGLVWLDIVGRRLKWLGIRI